MRFDDPAMRKRSPTRYLDLTSRTAPQRCSLLHDPSAQRRCAFSGRAAAASGSWRARPAWTATPRGLRDTAQSAYDDSKALLRTLAWQGRATYAITPRFSPTSTPEQLAALGALWASIPMPDADPPERADGRNRMGQGAFPEARDYLDTYEAHGLLGRSAVLWPRHPPEPREIDRSARRGAAVVHCPTSNTFIGSGLFDMAGYAHGMRLGWPRTPAAGRLFHAAHDGGRL